MSAGLGRRLLLALMGVVVVAALTALLVAGAVGPYLFHEHLGYARGGSAEDAVAHAEQAFRTAGALSLAIGLTAATAAAFAVSVFFTRRIAAGLGTLASAAREVADGRFGSRVPSPQMGAEFDALVEAFNDMAARLAASEALRHRLLSDVAHELRTPVATLSAHLEGLEDDVTELSPETVRLLRAQGSRLTRLAEDLAAVTRAESGETALVLALRHPADLVQAAVLAARERATAAGVDVVAVAPGPLPDVAADAERMGQVLGNLVDNALRHTPPGGRVTVAARQVGDLVELSVTDTGEGIAAEHLPHVFERFYRAEAARDRRSGGSGIGLAIVRALVEAHGGTVTAASDGPGRGARFAVTLPAEH